MSTANQHLQAHAHTLHLCAAARDRARDDLHCDRKAKPRTAITKFMMDYLTRQHGMRELAEKERTEIFRSIARFNHNESPWLMKRLTCALCVLARNALH